MQLLRREKRYHFKSKRYLEMRNNLFPKNYDPVLEEAKLIINLDYLVLNLGSDHKLVSSFFNGLSSEAAAKKLIAATLFKDRETVLAMFDKSPEEILALDDPFVKHFATNWDLLEKLRDQQREVINTENVTFGLTGTNSLQNVWNHHFSRCKQNFENK
ncbi:MAG: S46 family peptidase [Ignavibacteriales bacterium]|nr:S46 family peptidase [Ignavibacteriales bacterium]